MAEVANRWGIPVHIICVDTWLGAPEFWTWGLEDPSRGISLKKQNGYPQIYYTFLNNVKLLGYDSIIYPFPISSVQAVDVFKFYNIQADIIYLDGAHEYESVLSDIRMYWDLLKKDTLTPSFMMGDDFNVHDWPGVVKAVSEFANTRNLSFDCYDVVWVMESQNLNK